MNYEEKLLTYLVDKYRKSKKDSGENKTNRRTQVKPEKLYKKYYANDGNFEEISNLNHTVEMLVEKGFITRTLETFGTQLQCIYLIDEKILEIEEFLRKEYGYISKDIQIEKLKELVDKYCDASFICKTECDTLREKIQNRQIPKNIDELDDVLKAVAFIEHNQEQLYIREVSMQVYGDSKYFENNTLQYVCSLLRRYAACKRNDEELVDEILLDYNISKEPQRLCIKGKAILVIDGKEVDISGFSGGIEFEASELSKIESVKLIASSFMTIENRTSYLRYKDDDTVIFYLGGYANRNQRDFIKLVCTCNPGVLFKHFGDIDAGGFWIHHNLCEITGTKFDLFGMSVENLKNPEYEMCLHKLSENDVVRLHELKSNPQYSDVVEYMLTYTVKLEQEIVSLNLMKK